MFTHPAKIIFRKLLSKPKPPYTPRDETLKKIRKFGDEFLDFWKRTRPEHKNLLSLMMEIADNDEAYRELLIALILAVKVYDFDFNDDEVVSALTFFNIAPPYWELRRVRQRLKRLSSLKRKSQ